MSAVDMFMVFGATIDNEPHVSDMWQVAVLVAALALGALALTWRRKSNRSVATTHWCVVLSAHGALAATFHVFAGVIHIGGALVIVAMAERLIWEVSDSVAARIDSFMERLFDDAPSGEDDDPDTGQSPESPETETGERVS